MALEMEVLTDAEAVAERGAQVICDEASRAVAERGSFALAVSGGRTPWAMLSRLGERLPWGSVTLFQVDERVAPDSDPARNLTHLLESVPRVAAGSVRAMPVNAVDLEAGAKEYEAMLPAALDLVHLGLGRDGHTASLVPGDPAVDVADRAVALTGEYQGHRRMTLTLPVLNAARRVLWVVTGADKAEALRRLQAGDATIPAGRVAADSTLVLADEAAAGGSP